MSPSEFRGFIQETISLGDSVLYSKTTDNFLEFHDKIILAKEIGLKFGLADLHPFLSKLFLYDSRAFRINLWGKIFYFLSVRVTGFQLLTSNSERHRKKRYILEVKLILHGIDEVLRKSGY